MCRVIIAGGRDYSFCNSDYELLNSLHEKHCFTLVIHGDASGADRNGGIWAKLNGITVDPHPAKWSDITAPGAVIKTRRDGTKYNALAGFWRNQEMAEIADAIVCFPGGTGTADMVRRAKERGLLILRE